jgi:hypothetical protein
LNSDNSDDRDNSFDSDSDDTNDSDDTTFMIVIVVSEPSIILSYWQLLTLHDITITVAVITV